MRDSAALLRLDSRLCVETRCPMAVSSYQVQRLISRLRRRPAPSEPAAPAAPGGLSPADLVQLSERARSQAAQVAASLRLPPGTPVSAATIVDEAPLPPATLRELERRAGSFMRPPLLPAPEAPPFPRVALPRPAARGEPAPAGKGPAGQASAGSERASTRALSTEGEAAGRSEPASAGKQGGEATARIGAVPPDSSEALPDEEPL